MKGLSGIAVMLASAAGFNLMHRSVLPITLWCNKDLHQSIADRKKTIDWQNIIVSFLHAVFCSVFITYCAWMHGQEMAADLMHADVTAARLLLCMSAGYFLADSYDLWRNNKLTWDLAVHHVVVIVCYDLAILYGMFAPYLVGTLVVEFNNVFLHVRRLHGLAGYKRSAASSFYMGNLFLLIGTYPMFRFVPHVWLMSRVVNDYYHFPEPFMFWLAFVGMLVMNVLNVVLFGLLLYGDRAVLFPKGKKVA